MNWVYLISLACAVLSFKWAREAFDQGHNTAGWFNIVASAINAAAFAAAFF